MPSPAFLPAALTENPDGQPSDSSWYSAFTSTADPIKDGLANPVPPVEGQAHPDPLESLTAADIPGPHTRAADAPWQALLGLQRAELDRLAHENAQLMDRIGTLLQIQEREQVLRQQLQNQVAQIKLSPPTADLDAVRREARAGVTEELKPVLMAILDALERFARRPAPEQTTATLQHAAISPDPLHFEDYGRLPAILTRPLNELVESGGDPGRSRSGTQKRRSRKLPFQNRKQARSVPQDGEPAAGPGPFTWTTVFTS